MFDLSKYYLKGMELPRKEDTKEKTVLYMIDEQKESTMTFYHILPGIEVVYNDFNTKKCLEPIYQSYSKNLIEINHCRNGRFACTIHDNQYVSLGIGEMEANLLNVERKKPEFPLGFYEGIEILIDVPVAKEYLLNIFPEISKQIEFLKSYLESHDQAVLLKRIPELEHIFSELYSVKTEIKMPYIKIKVLEILLMIQTTPFERNEKEIKYYRKQDMDKIRAIHDLITSNLETKHTLESLSKQYNISATQLKNCFKDMYGMPIYTYLKHYKMHKAAHFLEETDFTINEIAGLLGYDNPSKFISAFKSILNCTPNEYKKENVRLDHLSLFGVEIDT